MNVNSYLPLSFVGFPSGLGDQYEMRLAAINARTSALGKPSAVRFSGYIRCYSFKGSVSLSSCV